MLPDLPPEILGLIFKEVRVANGNKQMTGGISKALLPYTRANLYDNIQIFDEKRLAKLVKTVVQQAPDLGALVTSLAIGPLTLSGNSFASSLLVSFFRQLENVKHLTISNSTTIAAIAITPAVTSTSFQHLATLSLEHVFGELGTSFHPSRFVHLASLPEIESISIKIGISLDLSPSPRPIFAATPPNSKSSLHHLSLEGDLTIDDPSDLISQHPSLTSLHLFDTSSSPNLIPLLESIVLPNLEKLRVEYDDSLEIIPPPIEGTLSNLPSLTTLNLGRSTFSSSFFDVLPFALPDLQHITFELGSEISAEPFEEMLSDPSALTSLTRITFNNVSGSIGPTIVGNAYYSDEDEYEYYSDNSVSSASSTGPGRGSSTCQGWLLPQWTSTFGRDDAARVMKAAERRGLRVAGTLEEAIRVDEEWEKEWAKANVYQKGAWDDLR